jgi:hypothetical protein
MEKDKETVSSDGIVDNEISPRTGKPIEKKFAPKNKRKANGKNSPMIGMNGYDLEDGDNAKYLNKNMHLLNLPDIDLYDAEQVRERINYYFSYMVQCDSKPTVSGLALALNGMSRHTLYAIANDMPTGGYGYKTALPKNVAFYIKKSYKIMETLWEDYVQNGKINPVMGIFLGKNNYGYQDKTEYVVTPNQKNENDYSADEIRERYITSDSQKRLSDSRSD